MELMLLAKGFVIGFAIAAPVGPIGVLCIRRTLIDGRVAGFTSGLGAATADASYGAVAAFGLTAVQALLVRQQEWLHIVGGLFLVFLGVRSFFSEPAVLDSGERTARGLAPTYLTTFVLTLANPGTIISFLFVFAGLRLAETGTGYAGAAFLTGGVFCGSATWWLLLSALVGVLRGRFSARWLTWVNRLAGALIFAFGVATLASS